jgi:hypothetical protein
MNCGHYTGKRLEVNARVGRHDSRFAVQWAERIMSKISYCLWNHSEPLRSICLPTLDEMTWRFNNQQNPFLFRDTMLKLIASDNLKYKELTTTIAVG